MPNYDQVCKEAEYFLCHATMKLLRFSKTKDLKQGISKLLVNFHHIRAEILQRKKVEALFKGQSFVSGLS